MTSSRFRLVAVAAAASVLALVAPMSATAVTPTGTLIVQVVQDGHPISDASINIESAEPGSFDGTGTRYTVGGTTTYPPLPAQTYLVTARIGSHFLYYGGVTNRMMAEAVAVTPGGTTLITIEFPDTGAVAGELVFDASLPAGAHAAYVEAFVRDELGGMRKVGRTDGPATTAVPQFVIENLPEGEVYLRTSDTADPSIESDYFDGAAAWFDAEPVTVVAGQLTEGLEIGVRAAQKAEVVRFGGATRFEMAVNVSRHGFPDELVGDGVPVVFITNGLNFPDALTAGPVAASRGPLLLTAPGWLPAVVHDELVRLAPEQIVIIGGPASVAPTVESELRTLAPEVSRITGSDRFEVSRTLARTAFSEGSDLAILTTGLNFPDALAAGAYAGAVGAPVILINGADWQLDAATKGLITELGVRTVIVVGGEQSVLITIDSQAAALAGVAQVLRISGRDRFDAAAFTPSLHEVGDEVFVANGLNFPDALAGSWLAGRYQAKLILVQPGCVPWNAQWSMPAADTIYVLGGPNSIAESTITEQPLCGGFSIG